MIEIKTICQGCEDFFDGVKKGRFGARFNFVSLSYRYKVGLEFDSPGGGGKSVESAMRRMEIWQNSEF